MRWDESMFLREKSCANSCRSVVFSEVELPERKTPGNLKQNPQGNLYPSKSLPSFLSPFKGSEIPNLRQPQISNKTNMVMSKTWACWVLNLTVNPRETQEETEWQLPLRMFPTFWPMQDKLFRFLNLLHALSGHQGQIVDLAMKTHAFRHLKPNPNLGWPFRAIFTGFGHGSPLAPFAPAGVVLRLPWQPRHHRGQIYRWRELCDGVGAKGTKPPSQRRGIEISKLQEPHREHDPFSTTNKKKTPRFPLIFRRKHRWMVGCTRRSIIKWLVAGVTIPSGWQFEIRKKWWFYTGLCGKRSAINGMIFHLHGWFLEQHDHDHPDAKADLSQGRWKWYKTGQLGRWTMSCWWRLCA